MKWLEILILVLIAAYCAYIIFGKKKRGCCGDCRACQGCAEKDKK